MFVYDGSTVEQPQPASKLPAGWVTSAVLRHKLVIATCLATGAAIAIAADLAITPVYESATLLLVGKGEGVNDTELTKLVSSHVRVAESEEVLRAAIERVGVEKFNQNEPVKIGGLDQKLRVLVWGPKPGQAAAVSPIDSAIFRVGKSVAVTAEPRSNLLKIAFRHADPVFAASFANALASSFIERQIELSDKPGAIDFLRVQKNHFETQVAQRSSLLEAFVKKQNTFSVEDQRELLLKRASETSTALATTRSSLAEKQGQANAFASQLRLLKPVTLSPYVSSLVDNLTDGGRAGGASRPPAGSDERLPGTADPPLLMIKVYQDEMVALFKLNADIKGLRDLMQQQQAELDTVKGELAALAGNQTEFEKLKRDVELATFNADLYAKRAVAEQIEADFRAAKLSSIKVVQQALVPLQSAYPKAQQFVGIGAIAGLLAGVAAALLLEMRKHAASARGGPAREDARTPRPIATAQERRPQSTRQQPQAERRKRGRQKLPALAEKSANTTPTAAGRAADQRPSDAKRMSRVGRRVVPWSLALGLIASATVVVLQDKQMTERVLSWAPANWLVETIRSG